MTRGGAGRSAPQSGHANVELLTESKTFSFQGNSAGEGLDRVVLHTPPKERIGRMHPVREDVFEDVTFCHVRAVVTFHILETAELRRWKRSH